MGELARYLVQEKLNKEPEISLLHLSPYVHPIWEQKDNLGVKHVHTDYVYSISFHAYSLSAEAGTSHEHHQMWPHCILSPPQKKTISKHSQTFPAGGHLKDTINKSLPSQQWEVIFQEVKVR